MKTLKKSLIFAIFSLFFAIFSLIFMQKNLDLIFSILDLEISIPDLENSKRAFRKKTPNLRKINPNFRQFFARIFAKISKWNFLKIKVFIHKLWVKKLRVCVRFFCVFKNLLYLCDLNRLLTKNYAYGKRKRKII